MKVLVAFESKGDTTKEYALAITKALRNRGIVTDVFNVAKKMPEVSEYSTIVVGTGVRAGRMYKNILKFLRKDMKGKRVALFFSTLQPKKQVMEKYVGKIMKTNPELGIMSVGVFGGRFRILFKTVADKFDLSAANIWAEELADKIM
ncbi:MAG: hypothetical protein JW700_00790 [Candidatus Aenigmarchaeota archaeon]|nr:hypothetical protein [Candidatus Aenigmarchaeota archaeon]